MKVTLEERGEWKELNDGKTVIREKVGYPTRTFEVVSEMPKDYKVWPIDIYDLGNYIPLCTPLTKENPFEVDVKRLVAIKVEDESFVRFVMRKAIRKPVNARRFKALKEEWQTAHRGQ